MRRVLLVTLSLVLAVVGGIAVGAEDGFYVIPSMKVVPKTGQTETYGPRDDVALQKGVAWPTPRFTDNNNGTVTDNLTRLIWMKDANAFGQITWDQALTAANSLKSGDAGLTDGSHAGDWRLPNIKELQSLVDYGRYYPALPADHPFANVQLGDYFSSSTYLLYTITAWCVAMSDGYMYNHGVKSNPNSVWCVRGGP
jgi:hypothetical protein